jgi:AbrB family looped-hinge helix DNA binding protein
MQSSSVTSKGQVTIPAAIRRRLGIRPGDRVGFAEEDGRVVIERQENRVEAAFGVLKARRGATLDQMEEAIAAGSRRPR